MKAERRTRDEGLSRIEKKEENDSKIKRKGERTEASCATASWQCIPEPCGQRRSKEILRLFRPPFDFQFALELTLIPSSLLRKYKATDELQPPEVHSPLLCYLYNRPLPLYCTFSIHGCAASDLPTRRTGFSGLVARQLLPASRRSRASTVCRFDLLHTATANQRGRYDKMCGRWLSTS